MRTLQLCTVITGHVPWPISREDIADRWFLQSMAETWLPLLRWARGHADKGHRIPITLAISLPLMKLMDDGARRDALAKHLATSVKAAEAQTQKHAQTVFRSSARFHRARRRAVASFYEEIDRDVLSGFAALVDEGAMELIASPGTHALLPLMSSPRIARAHIRAARQAFEARFEKPLHGLWLPDCAFAPELSPILSSEDIRFSFVDISGIGPVARSPWSPVVSHEDVTFFGVARHSHDVMASSWEGYLDTGLTGRPSGPFWFDEADLYTASPTPLLATSAGNDDLPRPYQPETGDARVRDHALDFVRDVSREVEVWVHRHGATHVGERPCVTCAFDAELMGRWWPEGPRFLSYYFRTIEQRSDARAVLPRTVLAEVERLQVATPILSSAAREGLFDAWTAQDNVWLHPQLQQLEMRVGEVFAQLSQRDRPGVWRRRALSQALRETMMAQASDWPAALRTGDAGEYAVERAQGHIRHAHELLGQLADDTIDRDLVQRLEKGTAVLESIGVEALELVGADREVMGQT